MNSTSGSNHHTDIGDHDPLSSANVVPNEVANNNNNNNNSNSNHHDIENQQQQQQQHYDHDYQRTVDTSTKATTTTTSRRLGLRRQLSNTSKNPITSATTRTTTSSQPSIKTPKDTLQAVYKAGIYKAGLPLHLLCIQSIIAGTYIALAGHMFLALNGGLLGAIFFPTGIIAVVFTSAELFTGDALVFVASVLGNKVSIWSLLRNWTISWIFNFIGCFAWAYVLGYCSGALDAQKDFTIAVAMKKVHPTWIQIFIKAMGANFLVCLGVWQATCAEEAAGKILALWFPVSGFVLMGFDHVIANQFLIPMGMLFGADISIPYLLYHALLPATLGNIVGGGICIGAVYWYVFDSMGSSIYLLSRIRWHPNSKHLPPDVKYGDDVTTIEHAPAETTTEKVK